MFSSFLGISYYTLLGYFVFIVSCLVVLNEILFEKVLDYNLVQAEYVINIIQSWISTEEEVMEKYLLQDDTFVNGLVVPDFITWLFEKLLCEKAENIEDYLLYKIKMSKCEVINREHFLLDVVCWTFTNRIICLKIQFYYFRHLLHKEINMLYNVHYKSMAWCQGQYLINKELLCLKH